MQLPCVLMRDIIFLAGFKLLSKNHGKNIIFQIIHKPQGAVAFIILFLF